MTKQEALAERVTREISDIPSADLSAAYVYAREILTREFGALLDEVQRLRALLREVEWQDDPDSPGLRWCPFCDGLHPDSTQTFLETMGYVSQSPRGHAPDCRLAAEIGDEP